MSCPFFSLQECLGVPQNKNTSNTEYDIIKGKYEGGIKIWECTQDLVGVISKRKSMDGMTVLEVHLLFSNMLAWLWNRVCRNSVLKIGCPGSFSRLCIKIELYNQ